MGWGQGIGIGWPNASAGIPYAKKLIKAFKERVLSYPTSIFEAEACLDATLTELNAIGLLKEASLVITPNAYNTGILYDVVPNTTLGDMDVVRATTATRVNSAGLIEVVPRNLLPYSNTFTNAAWTKINSSVVANTIISPDGTLNASSVINIIETPAQYIRVRQIPGTTIGQDYTFTCFFKKGNVNYGNITLYDNTNYYAYFDLTNGSIQGLSSGITANIQNLNNGWYKCSVTRIAVSTAIHFNIAPSYAFNSYASNLNDFVYIYGAQAEIGSTATEYFPTTTRLNIPRIDYTNGSCPSLLVEPQRTNLLTYSNTFSNATWVKLNCSVASNSIISPDGTQNSTTLTSSVTNNNFLYNVVTTANGLYTLSCFVKYLDTNNVNLSMTDFATGDAFAKFNFNTGIFDAPVVTGSWTNTTTNVKAFPNGWFRISLTSQKNAGTVISSRIDKFDTGKSIYIYGAQLEAGSYPTSYIQTVASTVTRNADVISKTGISSLIGTTYTVYGEIINEGIHNARHLALKLPTGGNYTDVVFIVQNFNGLQATANNSTSTAQFVINSGSYSIGQTLKYALRCEQNNVAFYINGVQIGVDTLCTIPAVSTLYIGNYVDLQLGSKIKSTMIFPSALTNTELAQLTTL